MTDIDHMNGHPEDGDLVRFLDHQATDAERRWLLAHLGECGACAARMEALRDQSETVSRFVGSLDAAPDEMTRARALSAARRAGPARGRFSGGASRAAAVAAVAALVTLGVEPLRAWVVDRWEALVGVEEVAPPVATAPRPLERGSVIRFDPVGEIFVLELRHAQAVGSLTLELRDVDQASAEVVGGAGEEILALPAGLRIENSDASTASYHFTLPADLRLIQVFAGGRPVAILPVEDTVAPWTRTVPLAAEPRH